MPKGKKSRTSSSLRIPTKPKKPVTIKKNQENIELIIELDY